MAPRLPPIVVYCPPAQQCSAVAPPAPPRPHPRPRPVPPPCRCPPFSPPPPHPPRASPAIRFVGEKGGRSRGVLSGFPALGRAGGALPSLALWARPRAPYLGASPGLAIQAVRDAIAPLPTQRGKTRPARTSGTECHPALCAPNYLFGRSPRTANNTAGRPATASRLVRPPRASGRVRRGRLTRSPLFPLCIALPQLLHSPMVAPRLRLGAGLCAGGAAQAPQLVKPGKTPVYPSDYHGNRA